MGADFTPTLGEYSGVRPFRFWCQKVLPLVYDDSLSYYEMLCKVKDYLNNVIEDVATAEDNIEELLTAYQQLENYVNTYFDSLDVTEEINDKLDTMATDGTLTSLLSPIVADNIGSAVASQIDAVVAEQIDDAVGEQIADAVREQVGEPVARITKEWLDENVTPVGSAVVVDSSLSISGAAADAKVTGDGIKNDLNILTTAVNGYIALESGSFSDGDGHTKTDRTDRIRCCAPIAKNAFFRIKPPEGYQMYTFWLNSSLVRTGIRGWSTSELDRQDMPADAEYFNISFRNTSNPTGDISSEVGTVSAGLTFYGTFDTSLNFKRILTSSDDLNDIETPGLYVLGPRGIPTNSPTIYSSVMIVYGYGRTGSARMQLVSCYAKGPEDTYIRYLHSDSTWSDWVTLAYSTTGENADLDEVLSYVSDIRRGGTLTETDDLDDITAHGMYYYNGASVPSHGPYRYNTLVQVFGGTSEHSSVMQRAYSYTTTHEGSAIRYLYLDQWSDWVYDDKAVSDSDSYVSGAGVNVRYPLNDTYSSANPNPYTYHQKVVTLAHFSDVHGHAQNFGEFMSWANHNQSLYDDLLCTGDIVEWYNETPDVGTDDYMDFWKDTTNAENILVTIGNHDAKDEQVSGKPNWQRKSIARSRELYMYGISNWNVVSPEGTTWWYKDYSNSNLRLIGLDTTIVENSTEDTTQLNWFTNVLNDARINGKHVVVAEHYQPADGVVIPCDFSAENRNIWSSSYFMMSAAYHTAVSTFINAGGTFICWLAGHTHTDFVAYNSNFPNQPFFVVTSLWNDLRTSDQARTSGTSSFIAANLIGFDTQRRLVKIARVGANYDFNLRPRNVLVYDYNTRTVIRQSSGMSE